MYMQKPTAVGMSTTAGFDLARRGRHRPALRVSRREWAALAVGIAADRGVVGERGDGADPGIGVGLRDEPVQPAAATSVSLLSRTMSLSSSASRIPRFTVATKPRFRSLTRSTTRGAEANSRSQADSSGSGERSSITSRRSRAGFMLATTLFRQARSRPSHDRRARRP